MLAEAILVHGVIGYKFFLLLPFEDQNQGTLAGHESAETPIGHESGEAEASEPSSPHHPPATI